MSHARRGWLQAPGWFSPEAGNARGTALQVAEVVTALAAPAEVYFASGPSFQSLCHPLRIGEDSSSHRYKVHDAARHDGFGLVGRVEVSHPDDGIGTALFTALPKRMSGEQPSSSTPVSAALHPRGRR